MHKNDLNVSIIALNQLKGIGRKRIETILKKVSNPNDYSFFKLVEIGISINIFSKNNPIGMFLDARDQANEILKICKKNEIGIVNAFSEDFPKALIFDDGPNLIYYKGDLSILSNKNRAAVVGTRVPSQFGHDFSYAAGKLLAKNGYTVISGLALGCDTGAHTGCLDVGGKTVAFLPSSITSITPKENIELAEKIIGTGGCLVTEFSPCDTSNAYMFIERDRLQAVSSNFVIVSEFARNSGTLHTLQFANSYEKPIYANRDIALSGVDGYESLREEGIHYNIETMQTIEKNILKNKQ
ncbi:MAG: DNA-processing protein DprA [Eubacterium sp.]